MGDPQGQGAIEVALGEHLERLRRGGEQPGGGKALRRDFIVGLKTLVEAEQVDRGAFNAGTIGEAALVRHLANQGDLPAFEAGLAAVAGAGLLAFEASTGVGAGSGGATAADPFARALGTVWRPQVILTQRHG